MPYIPKDKVESNPSIPNAVSTISSLNTSALISTTVDAENVGNGVGVYSGTTGTTLFFKSLSGSGTVTIVDSGNTIYIVGSSSSSGSTNEFFESGSTGLGVQLKNNSNQTFSGNGFTLGFTNTNSGYFGSMLGGKYSILSSNYSTIGNGNNNQNLLSSYSNITNGFSNYINTSSFGHISNGQSNAINSGNKNSILNGTYNSISSVKYSLIGNGKNNVVTGTTGTVLNGLDNVVFGSYNAVLNGIHNRIYGLSSYSAIGNGGSNKMYGNYSFIANGRFNIIKSFATSSTIIAGETNTINSGVTSSSILSGRFLTAISSDTSYNANIVSANLSGIASTQLVFAEPNGHLITSASSAFISVVTAATPATFIQNGLNTYTGGTQYRPTVNISAGTLSSLSVTGNLSGTTFYSGNTSFNDILSAYTLTQPTYVQNGLNTYTGGTITRPTVNLSSATLTNLTVTGVTAIQGTSFTVSSTSWLASTPLTFNTSTVPQIRHSSDTNTGFHFDGFSAISIHTSSLQRFVITSGGTIGINSSTSNADLFSNYKLYVSGNSYFGGAIEANSVSANTLSGNTIYSGNTNLQDLFVYSGSSLGSGTPVFKDKSNNLLRFKSLSGINISIVDDGSLITLSANTTSGSQTFIQNGLNTYTGGTQYRPTVNISAGTLSSLSVTGNLSGTTIYSGNTDVSTLFTAASVGSNLSTQINNKVNRSGDTMTGKLTVPTFSGGTVSGGTIFSGNTDVSSLLPRKNHRLIHGYGRTSTANTASINTEQILASVFISGGTLVANDSIDISALFCIFDDGSASNKPMRIRISTGVTTAGSSVLWLGQRTTVTQTWRANTTLYITGSTGAVYYSSASVGTNASNEFDGLYSSCQLDLSTDLYILFSNTRTTTTGQTKVIAYDVFINKS